MKRGIHSWKGNRSRLSDIAAFGVLLMLVSATNTIAQSGPTGLRIVSGSGRTTSVTQYGIQWVFDREYDVGTFVNGDYYVVGPVNIVDINPGVQNVDGRTINGSMVNPTGGIKLQGYDSKRTYSPALNVGAGISPQSPLSLDPGDSLVTAISEVPMRSNSSRYLKTAAVLTVVNTEPPVNTFRPGYAGEKKALHSFDRADLTLLADLTASVDSESIDAAIARFRRPWLDHFGGWEGAYLHPFDNMSGYGQDIANDVGKAAILLHSNIPPQRKQELLTNFIQVGIDLYSIVDSGGTGTWSPDGGHASGRKWPILFAGIMLDVSDMKNIGDRSGAYLYDGGYGEGNPPPDFVHFGEDSQTFYVKQSDIDRDHSGDRVEYQQTDLGLPEWGIRHATQPQYDNKEWDTVYRPNTGPAFAGFVLAARIMQPEAAAMTLWNHPALFDYMDRYVQITEDPEYSPTWHRIDVPFVRSMWLAHRSKY